MAIKTKITKTKPSKPTRTAVEVFNEETVAGYDEDHKFLMIFKTCEGSKGHGAQTLYAEHFDAVVKTLEFYAQHGIPSIADNQSDETPVQSLHRTIGLQSDGTVTFKLSGAKGSKSTLCSSVEDYKEFVSAFKSEIQEYKEIIKADLESAKEDAEDTDED